MKRADLMKALKEFGVVEVVREGAKHTIVRVNGHLVSIPRHNEINELTAKGILKVARAEKESE